MKINSKEHNEKDRTESKNKNIAFYQNKDIFEEGPLGFEKVEIEEFAKLHKTHGLHPRP